MDPQNCTNDPFSSHHKSIKKNVNTHGYYTVEVALCFTTKAVVVNTRENSNNVCVGAYVCMCVCVKKTTGLLAKLKP